ncbi:MAG TPA: hypothetical protein ENJ82_13940 [Bacteroidetes bacterium]|nr:hypothetical protein [Bacteroidota bacterium]
MKTKYLILSLLLLSFTAGPILAQRSSKLDPGKIQFLQLKSNTVLKAERIKPSNEISEGVWFQTWDHSREDQIVYKRKQKDRFQWGNYLEFGPENSVTIGYSAPCGNDTNIHAYPGKYQVKNNTMLLNLGSNGLQRYQIIEMSEAEMILMKM